MGQAVTGKPAGKLPAEGIVEETAARKAAKEDTSECRRNIRGFTHPLTWMR